MDEELYALLPQDVTYRAPTGSLNERGQPELSSASTTIPCRIEPTNGELVRRRTDQEEQVSKYKVIIPPDYNVQPQGELTLPAGYDPRVFPILAASRMVDDFGECYTRVML